MVLEYPKKKVLSCHPDKPNGSTAKFVELKSARDLLLTERSRRSVTREESLFKETSSQDSYVYGADGDSFVASEGTPTEDDGDECDEESEDEESVLPNRRKRDRQTSKDEARQAFRFLFDGQNLASLSVEFAGHWLTVQKFFNE